MTGGDRIDRQSTLRAPRSRVWQALTEPREFGAWFHVDLQGGFAPGRTVRGAITHPGFEHLTLELTVEQMQPERLFSFRWHPYAVDPAVDYSGEPMTLVEFRLESAPEGTRISLSESGFEGIPEARREEAYRMNAGGWDQQLLNIARHLGAAQP